MEMKYRQGEKIMVSPLVTNYHYWEEGIIIEVEDNPFNGIVITVEMPNGDVFFQRADSDYFSKDVRPFFVAPSVAIEEGDVHYCYDLKTTSTIKNIIEIIGLLPTYYYDDENEIDEKGKKERDSLYQNLLENKEVLKNIAPKQIVHGETQYDLEKQAMFVIKNRINKILYNIESCLQQELGLVKFKHKKDGISLVKGMDFIPTEVYISHIYCPFFAVEYTMYLGEREEGNELLCKLLLHFKYDEDESSSVFYKLLSGLLICGNYAKYLEPEVTYETLKSYIMELPLRRQSESIELNVFEEDDIFAPICDEVYLAMTKCNYMIRDKMFSLFKPMPLLKLQSLMENSFAQAKYVNSPDDNEYNELIKEEQLKEKISLAKRLKKIITMLTETMINPFDYPDLMIEYAQVKRKLQQL